MQTITCASQFILLIPVPEKKPIKIGNHEEVDSDTNRVEVQLTVLARKKRKSSSGNARKWWSVCSRQRSCRGTSAKTSKTGWWNWRSYWTERRAAEDDRKAAALPAENIAKAKRIADSPLWSELEKKRKEEDVPDADFIEAGPKNEGEEG